MITITDEELLSLPDEPTRRFVAFEALARKRLEEACESLDGNSSDVPYKRRYMSLVLPAAKHCGIEGLSNWERPALDASWAQYEAFISDVDFAVTELRLLNAEKVAEHSVALEPDARHKLRELLAHIRENVDKLDVPMAKKERIFDRVNKLQAEIDRVRTRYEAFAALMIEVCDDAGESARNLAPVVRLLERAGAALGVAKRAEHAKAKLPPSQPRKRIGPPKEAQRKGKPERARDEDIPF